MKASGKLVSQNTWREWGSAWFALDDETGVTDLFVHFQLGGRLQTYLVYKLDNGYYDRRSCLLPPSDEGRESSTFVTKLTARTFTTWPKSAPGTPSQGLIPAAPSTCSRRMRVSERSPARVRWVRMFSLTEFWWQVRSRVSSQAPSWSYLSNHLGPFHDNTVRIFVNWSHSWYWKSS